MRAFISGVKFGFYLGGAAVGLGIVLYSGLTITTLVKDFVKKEKEKEKEDEKKDKENYG